MKLILILAALLALLSLRQRERPLLVDASFHRTGGAWCDVRREQQAEPIERPRGIIHGRPTSGDTA